MRKSMIDFYILSDILDDEIPDVAIVICHFMQQAGIKTTLTQVRNDCYNCGDDIIDKYHPFIEEALDSKIDVLKSLVDKKLNNAKQLRDTINKLKKEIETLKATREVKPVKRKELPKQKGLFD